LEQLGLRLEVIELRRRGDRIAERRVGCDIVHPRPVDERCAPVAQARKMIAAGLDLAHATVPRTEPLIVRYNRTRWKTASSMNESNQRSAGVATRLAGVLRAGRFALTAEVTPPVSSGPAAL